MGGPWQGQPVEWIYADEAGERPGPFYSPGAGWPWPWPVAKGILPANRVGKYWVKWLGTGWAFIWRAGSAHTSPKVAVRT